LAEVRRRVATPATLAMARVMIEAVELASGFCTMTIADIAKRASCSTKAVKEARKTTQKRLPQQTGVGSGRCRSGKRRSPARHMEKAPDPEYRGSPAVLPLPRRLTSGSAANTVTSRNKKGFLCEIYEGWSPRSIPGSAFAYLGQLFASR